MDIINQSTQSKPIIEVKKIKTKKVTNVPNESITQTLLDKEKTKIYDDKCVRTGINKNTYILKIAHSNFLIFDLTTEKLVAIKSSKCSKTPYSGNNIIDVPIPHFIRFLSIKDIISVLLFNIVIFISGISCLRLLPTNPRDKGITWFDSPCSEKHGSINKTFNLELSIIYRINSISNIKNKIKTAGRIKNPPNMLKMEKLKLIFCSMK